MGEQAGLNPKDLVGARKAPLALVPPALVIGAAEALANGAEKYGPFNWRDQPVQAVTYVEAAMRHLLAYLDGEDVATDSGIHHVKHAVAGLAILLDCMGLGTLVDNRPAAGPAPALLAEQDKSYATIPPVAPVEGEHGAYKARDCSICALGEPAGYGSHAEARAAYEDGVLVPAYRMPEDDPALD